MRAFLMIVYGAAMAIGSAGAAVADVQVVALNSYGPGSANGRDAVVRFTPGPPLFPYIGSIPAGDFGAARGGAMAYRASPLAPGWTTTIREARWITNSPTGSTSGVTAIYAVPVTISPDAHTERWTGTLSISVAADDGLGDANNAGIFVNEMALPGTTGGGAGTVTAWTREIPVGVLHAGQNWVYFYVANYGAVVGGNPTGIAFAGTLTARPLSAGPFPQAGYARIGEAVDAAADGDVIPVLPGVYDEGVDIVGKSVGLRSTGGAGVTTIISHDALSAPLNIIGSDLSGPVEIEGFRIVQGPGLVQATTIVSRATMLFRSCIFEPNAQSRAIYVTAQQGSGASARLENCVFSRSVDSAYPFIGLGAFGLIAPARAEVLASNCTLVGRGGPAVGILVDMPQNVSMLALARLDNCIVRGTGGTPLTVQVSGPYGARARTQLIVRSSNVEGGWPGAGNIDADPMFADAASGDFRLAAGSPCIDAGANGLVTAPWDFDGVTRVAWGGGSGAGPRVDMGAFENQSQACGRDFNHDGSVDPDDLSDFITVFFTGCPR